MQAKQHAHAAHLQNVLEFILVQIFPYGQKHPHNQRGSSHTPPHQNGRIQSNESPQYARKAGDENGEMQQKIVFLHGFLLCRMASKVTMAVVTDTLSESAMPFMGMMMF